MTDRPQGLVFGVGFNATGGTNVARVTNTPRRTVRIADDLWNAAKAKADEQDEDLSTVIRKALERYVRSKK